MQKYFVIIPAAGTGTRMRSDRPKQYLTLAGQPILTRVVNLFSSHAKIEKVVVVLHAKDHWWPTLTFSHPEKMVTVIGGDERMHSVFLGLDFLSDFAKEDDWAIVHDASRPNVQSHDIDSLISALKNNDVGGLLGLPLVDTIKRVNQNRLVEETIPRENLWQAQTPQCFRYGLLKKAIHFALQNKKIVTDESGAIELLNLKPKMILGNQQNFKITFPEDLALAERFLEPI